MIKQMNQQKTAAQQGQQQLMLALMHSQHAATSVIC